MRQSNDYLTAAEWSDREVGRRNSTIMPGDKDGTCSFRSFARTTRNRLLPLLIAFLVLVLQGVDAFSTPQQPKSSSSRSNNKSNKIEKKKEIQDSGRDFASLQEWALENGVVLADGVGFQQVNAEGDDWTIAVQQQSKTKQQDDDDKTTLLLEAGSVVMSVPKNLVLSSPEVLKELGGESCLQDAWDILDKADFKNHKAEFLLFLKILKEVDLGTESRWYPWLESLPKIFETGVCFNDVELGCLPPFSRALADYERMKLRVFGLAASKLSGFPWLVGNQDNDRDGQNNDLYQWAFNVVYSRCWKFSDDLESGISDIVPIGDLFNHREPATVTVRNEETADTVDFVLTEDVPMYEGSSAASATGLYLSYGLTNPHRFLVIFGFVDDSMPEIFCQIIFPDPSDDHVAFGCADRSKMVYRTQDGAIANAIWDSILYALLAQKPEEQAALVRAHAKADAKTKTSIHATYALETALTLRNHVTGTIREMEALKEQIQQAADGDNNNQHGNLPLIQKHNDFLRGVFGKVEKRLDEVIDREKLRRRGR